MVTKKLGRNDTRPAARKPMADPKDQGMTAQEAVKAFCTLQTWAGTVSDDPEEREQALGDATSELTKMLAHKIDPAGSRRARLRARENIPQPAGNDEIRALAVKVIRKAEKKGVLDRGVQSDREEAVLRAMMSLSRDADQFDGPAPQRLWATGHKVGADPNAPAELIATDLWFFEGRGRFKIDNDIEANAAVDVAAGGGLVYVDLRIYTEPVQAVSGDAQDAVAIVDAIKACGDQLQQAAELSEPIDPASSAVRPNRRGRKKGTGGYDSKDLPLIKEMHRLITSEEPMGRYDAMLKVVDRAEGKTGTINKGKRLLRKYATKYDPGEGLSD